MADPNRALLESVVRLLAPVLHELVFVGGCTTGLFITDPAAGGIRPTRDVDAIVDVTSYRPLRLTPILRANSRASLTRLASNISAARRQPQPDCWTGCDVHRVHSMTDADSGQLP